MPKNLFAPKLRFGARRLGFLAVLLMSVSVGHASLQSQVEGVLSGATLGQTLVGVHIIDLTDGVELASIHADEPRIPASNMKLLTSVTALSVLGEDFRFHTRLTVHKDQEGRVRVIVHGDGDPAFCDRHLLDAHGLRVETILDNWAEAVRREGVTKIDELIIDDRVFDREFYHPRWNPDDYLKRSWAEVAGLNFYGNTLDVMAQPTRPGSPLQIQVYPDVPFLRQVNQAVTGNSDIFWINRRPHENHMVFGGSLRYRRSIPFEVTIHDPPMLFAKILEGHLVRREMTVGHIRRAQPDEQLPEGKLVGQYFTSLAPILTRVNTDSQNMFAEALVKRMGRAFTGSPGSWETGAAAMRDDLRKRLGTSAAAVRVSDGSGLSRDNAVTARIITRLLDMAYEEDRKRAERAKAEAGEPDMIFRNSLALAGREGTLRRRLTQADQALTFAKSGFINQVTTLSGYVVLPPGEIDADASALELSRFTDGERVVAFSLLFNNYRPPIQNSDIRQIQDRIVLLIHQHMRRTADIAQARSEEASER